MPDTPDVPRPALGGSSELADRLRALRSDARVGAALLVCVAIAAGVGVVPRGHRAVGAGLGARRRARPRRRTHRRRPPPRGHEHDDRGRAIVVDVVGAVRAPGRRQPARPTRASSTRSAPRAVRPRAPTSCASTSPRRSPTAPASPCRGSASRRLRSIPAPSPAGATPGDATGGASGAATGPIDVNTATADELEALPGIGPTLAAAIVQERDRNGPFRSVDELTRVPGIGEGRLAQLHDLVTV